MNAALRTRIKICGITNTDDARLAVEAGADAIGLVFAPGSPRCIDVELAYVIVCSLPPFVTPVALFVNEQPEEIERLCSLLTITSIQLHGDEDAHVVRALAAHFNIIRAIQYDRERVRRWDQNLNVDLLLVDGSAGGRGQTFAWNELAALRDQLEKPLIVAGGLTAENVEQAIQLLRPYAVDISSSIESVPGRKDPDRLRAFCQAVRAADR